MVGVLGGEKIKKIARFLFGTDFGPITLWWTASGVLFAEMRAHLRFSP